MCVGSGTQIFQMGGDTLVHGTEKDSRTWTLDVDDRTKGGTFLWSQNMDKKSTAKTVFGTEIMDT